LDNRSASVTTPIGTDSQALSGGMPLGAFGGRRDEGAATTRAYLIDEFRKLLSIRMASPEQAAGQLSGGNQQKIVLARWLALRPRILIVDEPTRGIDIGSKVEVHNLLIDMAKQGIAVIVISSEMPEVIGLSDRILVFRNGGVSAELENYEGEVTQETIMSHAVYH